MLERAHADRWKSNVWRQVILPILVLLLIMPGCSSSNDGELQVLNEVPGRIGYDKETGLEVQAATFTDLSDLNVVSAADLAQKILGAGITIKSVTFTGHPRAAGIFSFSEEDDVIGFSEGIVLSSGRITDLQGPNLYRSTTFDFGRSGDPDLTALVRAQAGDAYVLTYDAAVLTIDFTPNSDKVFLTYVFGSEEYNEYVNSRFNDVFAAFVNRVNYALINDELVAVNNVNCGNTQPASSLYPNVAKNTEYYHNNSSGAQAHCPNLNLKTELDGLTVVLTLEAPVKPNQLNTIKLAIADTADHILDAAVFIKAGSFTTPQNPEINIEKYTNGEDADAPPGPTIQVGQPVTWTYKVTNTGNVTLMNVTVTDDQLPGSDISCTGEPGGSNVIASLASVASVICSASGIAVAGQYANIGTATGSFNGMTVQATDPSHYFGQISGCTPGFWQGGAGSQLWNVANDPDWQGFYAQPYTHTTKFFGTTRPYTSPFQRGKIPTGDISSSLTMFEIVSLGGTSNNAQKAARSVIAAYLNASYKQEGTSGAYPLTRSEIANKWNTAASIANTAVRNAALASLHDELDEYNNTFDCRR